MQYLIWLGKVLTGDLGMSISNNRPSPARFCSAFENTIVIALIAVVLAFVLSMVFGIIAAYRSGKLLDRVVTAIAVFGISVPPFWLGVVLVILFAVNLSWLPATGMGAQGSKALQLPRWDDFKFAIMPIADAGSAAARHHDPHDPLFDGGNPQPGFHLRRCAPRA